MVANGARIARIVKDFMQKKKSKIILSRSSKLACLIKMVKKMNTFVVKNDTNPKNRMSSFNDRRENFYPCNSRDARNKNVNFLKLRVGF